MGSSVSNTQRQQPPVRRTVQTSQRQPNPVQHSHTLMYQSNLQTQMRQPPHNHNPPGLIQQQTMPQPISSQHQQVFQLPPCPPLPIMSPQRLAVFKNPLSIRIPKLQLVQEQNKTFIQFVIDTLVEAEVQVYAFVTEQSDIITHLTQQLYNYLYMDKQPFPKPSLQQSYKSKFGIDFSKIQAIQLKSQAGFWPLVIRLETTGGQEKIISFYYFEFDKDGANYKPKLKKQKIERNFLTFEIQEIYGIYESGIAQQEESKSQEQNISANISDQEKECIICFAEKIDTVIMPCRHMCICIGCASLFQDQQQKKKNDPKKQGMNVCPVCRKEIESFIRIKAQPQE